MAYFWKDSNFDWRATYAKWRSREYWTFLLPSSLLSVWIVWLPAVSIIYALPSSLQIPLFCIVCCFWSITLQLIAKTNNGHTEAADEAQPLDELHSDREQTVELGRAAEERWADDDEEDGEEEDEEEDEDEDEMGEQCGDIDGEDEDVDDEQHSGRRTATHSGDNVEAGGAAPAS